MKTESFPSTTLKNILVDLLWFLITLVCVAAILQLQSTVVALWIAFGGDRYALSLLIQVCILAGGFIAFAYVMIIEGYLRDSLARNQLVPSRNFLCDA